MITRVYIGPDSTRLKRKVVHAYPECSLGEDQTVGEQAARIRSVVGVPLTSIPIAELIEGSVQIVGDFRYRA